MNPYAAWIKIIGMPERAQKLRKLLNRLNAAGKETVMLLSREGFPVAYLPQRTPPTCPATVLFGENKASKIYANPNLRPALDAWDSGEIGIKELQRICYQIEGVPFWTFEGGKHAKKR